MKLIGSPEIKQLTTHPARELAPRWSFDGRHIAYLRDEPSGAVERVVFFRPWAAAIVS